MWISESESKFSSSTANLSGDTAVSIEIVLSLERKSCEDPGVGEDTGEM